MDWQPVEVYGELQEIRDEGLKRNIARYEARQVEIQRLYRVQIERDKAARSNARREEKSWR